jgi:hypothetical protein
MGAHPANVTVEKTAFWPRENKETSLVPKVLKGPALIL